MLTYADRGFLGHIKTIHFIGIGGIGMSGLAEILLKLNFIVQGSDVRSGATTRRLETLGAKICIGHAAENVAGADVIVFSSAVRENNPEIQTGLRSGIPIIRRAEMLAELMRLKYGIAVAGAHGKTTTSSLISLVLDRAGLDPTVVVGGNVKNIGTNARIGNGVFFVAEADESDESFLCLTPVIAVVTNIDEEHLDHYLNLSHILETFSKFMQKVPFFGAAIVCGDDQNIRSLLENYKKRSLTYGFSPDNDLTAEIAGVDGPVQRFQVYHHGTSLGQFTLNVPGKHMILNSLAAIGTALELNINPEIIRSALMEYSGVKRRLEHKGEICGITVMDDYAHHPTEIRATLNAVRQFFTGRLWVVFQPHRFTRTFFLMDGFAEALKMADQLVLLPVYAASETPIQGADSSSLAESCARYGQTNLTLVDSTDHAARILTENCKPGDLVITLGAGNVYESGEKLLEYLQSARTNEQK